MKHKVSLGAAEDVHGHRKKEKGFLQAGTCCQSRARQVSLGKIVCVGHV